MSDIHSRNSSVQPANFAIYGIFPAMKAGLSDSFNPCILGGVLLFVVFLFFIARGGRRLGSSGFRFIIGLIFAKLLIELTIFDSLFADKWFGVLTDLIYILIAIGSIGIGCLLFRDWIIGKNTDSNKRLAIRFPFLNNDMLAPGKKRNGLLLNVGFFVLGVIVAFLISLWPSNLFVHLILYEIALPGKLLSGFLTLLVYILFYSIFFLVIWAFVLFASGREQMMSFIRRRVALVQISLSAIFLGYGVGLIARFI